MARLYLIFLGFAIFAFLLKFSYSQLSIDVYSEVNNSREWIFYGDNIIVEIKNCSSSDLLILENNEDKLFIRNPSNKIKLTPEDYKSQSFKLEVYCGNESANISVNTSLLDFKLESIENNYLNEKVKIGFDFLIKGELVDIRNFTVSFSYTNDFKLRLENNVYYLEFFADKLSNATEKISVTHIPSGRVFTLSFPLEIKNPLDMEIYYEDKIYYPESNITIKLLPKFKDSYLSLNQINLRAFLNDKEIYNFYECSDKICLDVSSSQVGEQNLIITLEYNNFKIAKTLKIKIGKLEQIKFYDIDGNPLNVEFLIGNQKYNIVGNGSILFLPGIYNLTLRMPSLELKIYNVNLQSLEDSLRIYPISLKENKLKILNFFVFESNLNFELAKVKIYYDETKVKKEERIIAIRCLDFSKNERKCNDYKIFNYNQNLVSNFVEFEISKVEYFGLIEKKSLNLQYSLNKNEYNFNEDIVIKGIVSDEEGKPQESEVIVRFLDQTKLVKTKDGMFEISLKSPSYEGTFPLSIKTSNQLFENVEERTNITVRPKIELSISPNSIRIKNESEFYIILTNLAQIPLLNISISSSKSIVIPNFIEKMEINEERRLKIANFSFDSNPLIINLFVKTGYRDFNFEIPIYFDKIGETSPEEKNNPSITGQFYFPLISDLSKETVLALVFSVIILGISIVYSRKKKEEGIFAKGYLKNKFK